MNDEDFRRAMEYADRGEAVAWWDGYWLGALTAIAAITVVVLTALLAGGVCR